MALNTILGKKEERKEGTNEKANKRVVTGGLHGADTRAAPKGNVRLAMRYYIYIYI
jgi:hypothetical protein